MSDRYPDEPRYSCPIIDDIQNELNILEGEIREYEHSCDFKGLIAQLEEIREINETLREDARNFHNIALRAKEVLEEL